MSSRICQVCRQTEGWHIQHHPMHVFVADGDEPRLEFPAETPTPPMGRGDPILRLALLKIGVIREPDLTEAETWLRTAAEQGMTVTVEHGEYRVLSIEDWIKHAMGVE